MALWFLSLAVAAIAVLLPTARPASAFETAAQQAYVVDFQTGSVLLEKSPDEPVHPASMSKLMTLYVLFERLESGQIALADKLPVSEAAWALDEGSTMFVGIGTEIAIEDLIRGIVVQSGNDACLVVAEGLAGSEPAFVDLMNKKAAELGLAHSRFVNSHGLEHPDHKMTARDLATLATRLIADFPAYYPYFAEKEFVFNNIKQGNRNPLLYGDTGADGLKTGHLLVSGYGIVASALREGRRIVMVLHGMADMQKRAEESRRVLDWAFRETENVLLARAGQALTDAPVWLGDAETVPLVPAKDVVVTLPRGARQSLSAKAVFDGPVPAPIGVGQAIGKLVVQGEGLPPFEAPLVAGAAVGTVGTLQRIVAALLAMQAGGQ